MMGHDMGVVCIVDSLRCLKENSLWRQKASDFHMPTRPKKFKLGGERTNRVAGTWLWCAIVWGLVSCVTAFPGSFFCPAPFKPYVYSYACKRSLDKSCGRYIVPKQARRR